MDDNPIEIIQNIDLASIIIDAII